MAQNIIVSIFEVESEAYQAFTTLKQEPYAEKSFLKQAILVKKEKGGIQTLDYFDTGAETTDNTAIGGVTGALVGLLGGPVGVLLGAGYGMLVGSNIDAMDSLGNASMIEQIIEKLQDDEVAIIGLANEEDESVLDDKLAKFKTITARFDAAVVAEEVEEALLAEKELARQTRAALRKEKGEEFKGRVEKRRAKMKELFDDLEEPLSSVPRY